MEFNESNVHRFSSKQLTPEKTPSPPEMIRTPPAISTTDPGGLENDAVIDGNESGVLRSRGRRRRPGRARVRLQEIPNTSQDPTLDGDNVEESSDFLQPHTLTFFESPSQTSSRLGSARGSFRNLVSKVSQKMTPKQKQGRT